MFNETGFFEKMLIETARSRSSSVSVLLHVTGHPDDSTDGALPVKAPFELVSDVYLLQLPARHAELVLDACDPRLLPGPEPERSYAQLFTVAHFSGAWEEGGSAEWDPGGRIRSFVTCAQLSYPTSLGFAYAATLNFDASGKLVSVEPGPCRDGLEYATVIENTRNWFAKEDCTTISSLMARPQPTWCGRAKRANWYAQMAAFQWFVELKGLLIVAGLEALLHVNSKDGPRKKFALRMPQLAEKLGLSFSEMEARSIYTHRSDVAHGLDAWQYLGLTATERANLYLADNHPHVRLLAKAGKLLRIAVCRAITDPEFEAMFVDDDAVATHFPITSESRKREL